MLPSVWRRLRSIGRAVALSIPLSQILGRGLVFQGFHQSIQVSATPPGAGVKLGAAVATAPASLTVNRREDFRLVRASMEGFHPACRMLRCPKTSWVVALDAIPAAIPLAIDAILGTLRACPPAMDFAMSPVQEPTTVQRLPVDSEIFKTFNVFGVNLCELQPRDPKLKDRMAGLIVTTGGLSRTYDALGSVDVGIEGKDFTVGSYWAYGRIGFGEIRRYFAKAPPSLVNEIMKVEALDQFGDRVDAVVTCPTRRTQGTMSLRRAWRCVSTRSPQRSLSPGSRDSESSRTSSSRA